MSAVGLKDGGCSEVLGLRHQIEESKRTLEELETVLGILGYFASKLNMLSGDLLDKQELADSISLLSKIH